MKADKMKNIAVIILLATQLFAQTRPAVELEGAIAKEQVDGDLKTAIAIYQKIAADTSAPRDIRARALLHLGRCYEKLGQQSQAVYRQIVRDFGDQPEAVQAKARLAALAKADHPAAPATMTQRKIENPGMMSMNPGETDGHRAVYQNAAGELIYGDLGGKSKRVIFKAKSNGLQRWFPSRDFSMVALLLNSKPGQRETLAIVRTDGTGYREIAHVNTGDYGCGHWSWDNRYLLLCGQSQGAAAGLLRVSIADGQIRELLTLKAGTIRAASFSPDGHLVVYQIKPSDADQVSRIFILPAEGGESKLVYEEGRAAKTPTNESLKLLDWTADGRYLAIASERTGKGALHLLPMMDGKSAGATVFVKYGDFEEGVTTAAGGLIYKSVRPGGLFSVYLASLDTNSRPGNWKRLDLQLGSVNNPWPKWSGNSNQIAYVARSQDAGQTGDQIVHLLDLSTGEDREAYHASGFVTCVWAVQQPKLFCADIAKKAEIFSLAVDSGEITRIQSSPAPLYLWLWCPSRDDRSLYMYKSLKGGVTGLVRWDIATERETTLEQFPAESWYSVSRDERWLIRLDKQNLAVRPASGSDWNPLGSFKDIGQFGLAPDGNWLVYHNVDSAGEHSLFRVATGGGAPERVGNFPTSSGSGSLEISPDGTKIVVAAADFETGYELWSLESFVPPAPKR